MSLSARKRFILRATLGYLAFAATWILLSDRMLADLTSVGAATRLSTAKGLAFVAVTSMLLWLGLRHVPDRSPDGAADAADAEGRPRVLVGVFLLLATAIAIIAGLAFMAQSEALRGRELHKLEAIARLKADGVARWLGERRANAVSLARSPTVRTALARLTGRHAGAEHQRLLDLFRERAAIYGFSGIDVLDAAGRRIVEEGPQRHDPVHIKPSLFDAARSGEIAFVDLHRDRRRRDIHLALLSPVFEGEGAGRRLLGIIYLEAEPHSFLYPYLKEWPALETTTGETLMVRQEGDEVVFLSELRYIDGAPLVLRRPLSESSLPAARALKGQSKGALGRDYRGASVLAASQQVPGTPWTVVAKVDESEALAAVRRLAWMTGLLVAAALAVALVFIAYLWQIQRRQAAERAEEALKSSEERFRGVFDNALDGILVADAETRRFCMSNPAIRQMLGYEAGELLRIGVADIHPEQDIPHVVEQFEKLALGEIQLAADIPVKRKDGSVFIADIKGSPLHVGDRLCLVGVFRDVTERKRWETGLRRLNAELEERVRQRTAQLETANLELEKFSYSVSHDLKAPLRGIDGYSRLLLEEHAAQLDEEGRGFLDNILKGVRQMHDLIEDLLAYSRMERRELSVARTDLAEVVARAIEELGEGGKDAAKPAVDLACRTALADPEGLALALRNLIDNAIKFSSGAQPPKIEIGSRAEGGRCLLWVKDNGIGFDMKHGERIFGMFQRLHGSEEYPGTGVGLAIVRKAMERMGGSVRAESAPGEGATFFLELPL